MARFVASSKSAESGPANGSHPGKGIRPSRTGKTSAYGVPSDDGKPPTNTTFSIVSGRASVASHAKLQAAECPTTIGRPCAVSMASRTAAV